MKKSKLMKALLVFGMSAVTATAIVGFTACDEEHTHVDADKNGKCDVCGDPMPGNSGLTVDVENVELNKGELTLDVGDEETLVATVTPDNADDKTVTWISSDPSVATVDDNGKVTAEEAGEATITATAGDKTATCLVTVNTPEPKPVVTKEEWEAALSESAFTNFTATVKMSDAGEDETGDIIKVDLANDKFSDRDVYYSKEADGKYYKYTKAEDSEKYAKDEITQDEYEGDLSGLYPMYATLFKDVYENENVEYNSEKESYVGTDIDIGGGNTYGIEVKFDNGKLIYADIDYGEDAHIIIEYSKYGKTTIDLPKVDEGGDEEGGITEEQWAQILESADNYTYTQTLPDMSTVNKVVGNKWQQTDGTGEVNQIVVKDGESYDLYVQNPDTKAWEKSTVSAAEAPEPMVNSYNFALGILKVCKDDKKSFHYDDGKYIAETIDKTSTIGVTLQNVVAEFDDGKLIKVTFSADGASYEINSVGSTEIELPQVGGGETDKVDVEKVELNKDELTLEVGGEETLTATVTPDNADDKTVTWTSSSPSVATVDDSGKVTAVAAGTATITATADGQSATCSVTVNDPDPGDETGIELAFSNITRYGGANNDENVEMTVKWDNKEGALDMGADKQFDAAYINGTLNDDTGWADEGPQGGDIHQGHLWLRGFKAEYDTKYVVTLKKGDTVVATGTLLIESPKSMTVSSDTENALIGNILTLNPEDVVMLEASITGNFPAGAAYDWVITEGAEYIELEFTAETAMITAKEYSGESNVTAKVKVTYGVEGTTVSTVISVTVKGTGNNDDDPYAAITFVIASGNHYATQWCEFDLTKDNQPSGITYAAIKDSFTSYKVMVAGDEEKTNLAGAGKNMFPIGVEDAHYHVQLQNTEDWKSGTTYNIEFYNGSTLIAIAIFSYQ